MSNITKEGIEVKVGQVWKDLDKRMEGRTCRVIDVTAGRARMQRCRPDGELLGNSASAVAVRRMHKASQGWQLIKEIA